MFAAAQSASAGGWTATLANGVALPLGPTTNIVGKAYEVAVSANYKWKDYCWPGLEAGYSFNHAVQGITTVPDRDGDHKSETLNFTSDSTAKVFHVTPVFNIGKTLPLGKDHTRTWRPYALLGAGYFHAENNAGTATAFGATTRGFPVNGLTSSIAAGSFDYFGINLGLGADFQVTPHFSAGAAAQYRRYFISGQPDRRYVTPALRLTGHF